MRDPIWDALYAPDCCPSSIFAAERLNVLQFLTIRSYLLAGLFGARTAASGACNMAVIHDFAFQGLQMLLVLAAFAAADGLCPQGEGPIATATGASAPATLSRSLSASCARTSCWQTTPRGSSVLVPYVIFAATWVAASLVPTFRSGLLFSWTADFIAIIALLGSARFALALAALDVGTSFGGIGSSREVMIASLAEPAMLMIVFTLALIAGSTQLSTMSAFMNSPEVGLRVSLGLGLIALVIVAIAENARIPVDNPARTSSSPWCTRPWCWNIPVVIWH